LLDIVPNCLGFFKGKSFFLHISEFWCKVNKYLSDSKQRMLSNDVYSIKRVFPLFRIRHSQSLQSRNSDCSYYHSNPSTIQA
jgi:hypothetical protein